MFLVPESGRRQADTANSCAPGRRLFRPKPEALPRITHFCRLDRRQHCVIERAVAAKPSGLRRKRARPSSLYLPDKNLCMREDSTRCLCLKLKLFFVHLGVDGRYIRGFRRVSMSIELQPDICVIGGGPGGLAVALGAAAAGKSVVVVEKSVLGGRRLSESIPRHVLLAASRAVDWVRRATDFGIK